MTNIGNNKETHDIVENSVYTPSEVLERIMQAGEKRILLPVVRCILLGMLAGGFIAFGAAASAAIFFPIMAFVVGGWEHCVANMFYLPAGIFAVYDSGYVEKATELYGLRAQQIQEQVNVIGFLKNMIPVTIGNIVGAMVFIALPLFIIHKGKASK